MEVTVFCRQVYLFTYFYQRLFLESVFYHVFDGDDFQTPFLSKLQELWQAGHGAIFVHDFHQCAGRVESRHLAKVDGGLGMSASAQHSVVLCI